MKVRGGRSPDTHSTSNQLGVIMVASRSIALYMETTFGETYKTPESPMTAKVALSVQLKLLIMCEKTHDLRGIRTLDGASAVSMRPLAQRTVPLGRVCNLQFAMCQVPCFDRGIGLACKKSRRIRNLVFLHYLKDLLQLRSRGSGPSKPPITCATNGQKLRWP